MCIRCMWNHFHYVESYDSKSYKLIVNNSFLNKFTLEVIDLYKHMVHQQNQFVIHKTDLALL